MANNNDYNFYPTVATYGTLHLRNFKICQNDRLILTFTQAVPLYQEIVGHCYVVCIAWTK